MSVIGIDIVAHHTRPGASVGIWTSFWMHSLQDAVLAYDCPGS